MSSLVWLWFDYFKLNVAGILKFSHVRCTYFDMGDALGAHWFPQYLLVCFVNLLFPPISY